MPLARAPATRKHSSKLVVVRPNGECLQCANGRTLYACGNDVTRRWQAYGNGATQYKTRQTVGAAMGACANDGNRRKQRHRRVGKQQCPAAAAMRNSKKTSET